MKNFNKDLLKRIINIKSFLVILTICLIIFLSFLLYNLFIKVINEKKFEEYILCFSEKNENYIFSIDKIVLFSSCDSKFKTGSSTNFTIENLYTYTDIALFINNNSEENTSKNTLKSVKINNINFTIFPLLGTPKLFYKNINNFATSYFDENYFIDNELNFNISSDNLADLSIPTLYNNCANPITLTYVNENIKTDYTLTDVSKPITYDGSLLQRCFVDLDSIYCSLSFDIYIENNNNEKFKSSIFLNIPYESEEKNIYDGYISKNIDTSINFYRYK